jgi:hydrogenase maturation factor
MSAATPDPSPCTTQHCATCADEALPMTVLRLDQRRGLALCADERGGRTIVETALLDPLALGDLVLVHAGVAIAALPATPAAARRVRSPTLGGVAR